MKMKAVLMPYKATSGGAKQMAAALGLERIAWDGRFDPVEATTAINWGRGDWPAWRANVVKIINPPDAVLRAIDKVASFRAFKRAGVPCPQFTTDMKEAQGWARDGFIVFCRTNTQGKNAEGLVIAKNPGEVVAAPLYTKYKDKGSEYRIHSMNGEAFYANIKTKKKAANVPPGASPFCRSGSHGWFFSHLDKLPQRAVCEAAENAVKALGLDFGGVDVGVSEDGTIAVYEVNTAPEMGPNTTAAYLKAFKKHYGAYKNNENVAFMDL
jgi:hypothetical protein